MTAKTTKKTTTKKTTTQQKTQNNDNTKEIEAKIAQLETLIKTITESRETVQPTVQYYNTPVERDIMFVSLCFGQLNLCTGRNGDGDIYTFNSFGEEQMIPLTDAKSIIKNNKKFITQGKVYIDDGDLIASERLTKAYDHILNAEGLLNLFNESISQFKKIFKNISTAQKECFKDMLIQKLLNNEDVDRNLVAIVDEELKTNIMETIKNGEGILE